MPEVKPYTLDDYSKQIITNARQRFVQAAIADDIMRQDSLLDMKAMCYKPITRWQRFKYHIEDLKQRAKDIWTIVSGGDVHKDCGY